MKKVGFVSLGCPKNLVNFEVMMGQIKAVNYMLSPTAGTKIQKKCKLLNPCRPNYICKNASRRNVCARACAFDDKRQIRITIRVK